MSAYGRMNVSSALLKALTVQQFPTPRGKLDASSVRAALEPRCAVHVTW